MNTKKKNPIDLQQLALKLGFHSICLSYDSEEQCLDPGDEECQTDFVRAVEATVWGVKLDESLTIETKKEIGRVQGHIMHFASALNAGVDLVLEADAVDGDVCAASEVLQGLCVAVPRPRCPVSMIPTRLPAPDAA